MQSSMNLHARRWLILRCQNSQHMLFHTRHDLRHILDDARLGLVLYK